ncbi:MAG TPA: amidohydrolase family protein [Acetobacteraceae bacterium]|nr:amidohydrolase family protein [Acetobacteraceae bacterium]
MSATADVQVFTHPVPNPAWLGLVTEDIIDPALPIIDPHHHLWERDGQPYFLDELLADTGTGHNIVATVYLQCGWAYRQQGPEHLKPVGETEFVRSVAEQAERRGARTKACAGIVGFADLNLGDAVDEVLEAHIEAAGGRFRGIRHLTAREETFWASIAPPPPSGMMRTDAFRRGFARLRPHGLSFDAWLYHHQIPELTALARAYSDTPIVLNHVGGRLAIGRYESQRDEVFAAWRANLRELARCPNVSIKLGGFGMRLAGYGFNERPRPPTSQELAAAIRPTVEACIEAFGPNRAMFESNFPVDKAMFSYPVMWNAFKRLTAEYSASDKAALFHDTAAQIYRI